MRALLVLMMLLSACSSSNNGGNEGPGGGDVTAQEASTLTAEIYAAVRAAPRTYPEVNVRDLQQTIARAKILIKNQTFANGVETDANNDGIDTIELNRQRWRFITERDRKRALLFHEILGLMGLEKNNYFISSRMLKAKNRFMDEARYTCRDNGGAVCEVTMRFDRSQDGFVVKNTVCNGFTNLPVNLFRRVGNETYSTNGYCPEPEEDLGGGSGPGGDGSSSGQLKPVSPCSVRAGDGIHWDTLNFLDGYEFFFTGRMDERTGTGQQLHCRP